MVFLELSKMEKEKKESEEKKNKKDKSFFYSTTAVISFVVVLGLTLLGIKIFSPPDINDITAEIIEKGHTDDGYMYNGFVFIYKEGLWHTKWQRGDVLYNTHFHYGPLDVLDIPVIGYLNKDLDTSKFYITFDPLEKNISLIALGSAELGLSLVKVMGVKITPACYRNITKACYTRPIITCDNTEEGVIFIKSDETTKVTLDNNCITIQGKGDDLLKAVDKVLFNLYGIIKHEQDQN